MSTDNNFLRGNGYFGSPLPSGLERIRLHRQPDVITPKVVNRNGGAVGPFELGEKNDDLIAPLVTYVVRDNTAVSFVDLGESTWGIQINSAGANPWDGLTPGTKIKVVGSVSNDGVYTLGTTVIDADPNWTRSVVGTLTAEAAGAAVTITLV